ncbi:MAG: EamA family transporter, partial [Xanthomonadales bacterium]|nr:EamA family transporter [Xanthomonadales bacterium]
VLGLCLLWYRGAPTVQFRGLGLWALGAALLQSLGLVMFVVALEYTSAANVLIFFATTPLIAAVMAWGVLGERVAPVTWAAIAVVLTGILVVASGSLGTVNLFGDFLAFLDAVALAGFYVIIRRHREVNL